MTYSVTYAYHRILWFPIWNTSYLGISFWLTEERTLKVMSYQNVNFRNHWFQKNIFKEFKLWPLNSSATQKWIELILWIIKAIGGIFSNLFIKVGSCNVEEKFSFGAHRVDWNNNFQSKESIPQARLMGVPSICW